MSEKTSKTTETTTKGSWWALLVKYMGVLVIGKGSPDSFWGYIYPFAYQLLKGGGGGGRDSSVVRAPDS